VVGKSTSHHPRDSAWQRTELLWVYGDTGITEMDWASWADQNTGVEETDGATWSIYMGDPGVDSVSDHLVPYHILPYNELHTVSFPSCDLTRSV